jgi:CitMHS family citrate-Mg2+:H+ or citrate-Ca2+:H+ symporter
MGFLIIVVLLFLVLTKRATVHFALVIPPVILALLSGFNVSEISGFIGSGISGIASTGIMLTFAVLYFGVMFDAGMFDPVIKGVIKLSKGDPAKIAVGTAVIAMVTHLDGSGASTFLITVSAMLPIYKALKMNKVYLAAIAGLGAGTMNMVPWGGPTIRAASALNVDVIQLFNPLLPVLIIGIIWVLVASYLLGRSERDRIGLITELPQDVLEREHIREGVADKGRGEKMIVVNLLLTATLIFVLIKSYLPLHAVFIIGLPIALFINYEQSKHQGRIEAHAKGAIYTSSIIFSAGVFTGILRGAGMIEAMSQSLVSVIPTSFGSFMPAITGIFSMPLSLFFDPDSFYFGVLPVLSSAAEAFGVSSLAMGRAAIMGQMTTGFPASPLTGATWLLIGLVGIELGDLQKVLIPRAFITTVIMVISALILGII